MESFEDTNIKNQPSTYLCLEDSEGMKLEIDLMQFREKNVLMKYLSFSFSLKDENGRIQNSFVNIDNKDNFDIIKNFFQQLDWNN